MCSRARLSSITTHMDESFLKLLQVCDSVFPVGAFTLSNGLETYVQKDLLSKSEDLEKYLEAWLEVQTHGDFAIAANAFKSAQDINKIRKLDELSAASKIPSEVRAGSRKMCSRFFKLVKSMGVSSLEPYSELVAQKKAYGQYPVAFGIYANQQGVSISDAVTVFAYSQCSAIITNTVKLVPLSQIDGQRILYGSLPKILKRANEALSIPEEEIGISLPGIDIRSMQHERLFTRQYSS